MNKVIRLSMDLHAPPTRVHGYLILSRGNMYITCDRFLATVFSDKWTDEGLMAKMALLLERTQATRVGKNIEYSVTHVIEYDS